METLFKILISHLIGDYVLQIDYLAKTKGENWYNLFVHCALYLVPFYLFFGFDWRLVILFISHVIIDALKARYNKINYAHDQILHYIVALVYYLLN